jgi:hypothetical protein
VSVTLIWPCRNNFIDWNAFDLRVNLNILSVCEVIFSETYTAILGRPICVQPTATKKKFYEAFLVVVHLKRISKIFICRTETKEISTGLKRRINLKKILSKKK